jgi:hypothetical protein
MLKCLTIVCLLQNKSLFVRKTFPLLVDKNSFEIGKTTSYVDENVILHNCKHAVV